MNNGNIRRLHFAEADSTNNIAKGLSPQAGEAILITADYQTAGRGQRGNTWEAMPGKNLLFSLVLKPDSLPASEQFVICELISVALSHVLSAYTEDIRIKWPNDIYCRDGKLAGILIEHDLCGTELSRTIIGIGLNVNQTRFESDAPNPVSLAQILGHEVNREELLTAICEEFLSLLRTYERDSLHAHYNALLYRLNTPARYRDAQGDFRATLRKVERDGRLILEDETATLRSYLFKEVGYVITQP